MHQSSYTLSYQISTIIMSGSSHAIIGKIWTWRVEYIPVQSIDGKVTLSFKDDKSKMQYTTGGKGRA